MELPDDAWRLATNHSNACYAYVISKLRGSISTVNICDQTTKHVQQLPYSDSAIDIIAGPQGTNKLYVLSRSTQTAGGWLTSLTIDSNEIPQIDNMVALSEMPKSLTVSHSGVDIFIGTENGHVISVNAENLTTKTTVVVTDKFLHSLAVDFDDKYLYMLDGIANTIWQLDIQTGQTASIPFPYWPLKILRVPADANRGIIFSPDSQNMTIAGRFITANESIRTTSLISMKTPHSTLTTPSPNSWHIYVEPGILINSITNDPRANTYEVSSTITSYKYKSLLIERSPDLKRRWTRTINSNLDNTCTDIALTSNKLYVMYTCTNSSTNTGEVAWKFIGENSIF